MDMKELGEFISTERKRQGVTQLQLSQAADVGRRFVVEVEVVKYSGGFYLIRYPKKTGGYKVRESRLYKTEAEAKSNSL